MATHKQQLNVLRTVTYADLGDYRIWIGTYNPMNMYSQMLAARVAEVCAEAARKLTIEDAERRMIENVQGGTEIVEAMRAGPLLPLTAPKEPPIRGPGDLHRGPDHARHPGESVTGRRRTPACAGKRGSNPACWQAG